MQNNKLIEGKSETQKIVSLVVNEDKVVYFTQNEDGSVTRHEQPNKLWVLTENPLYKTSVRLKGEQHFKYGTQFTSKDAWITGVNYARKTHNDAYTIWNHEEATQVKDGITYFKGMKFNEPSILSFDIESTGLYHNSNSRVLLISNTLRRNGIITRRLFAYDDYSNQGEMIADWCSWVREVDPSIICGHNIYSFDIPYIQFVAAQNGTKLLLGRDGSELDIRSRPSKYRVDGSREQEYRKVRVFGRELIDTMFLALKYDVATRKYESYGLKYIIKAEKLEKEDRVMYDAGQIRFNYTNPEEWAKIKQYCEHDADDSLALYDLMGPSLFYLTQSVPKPYQLMLESATGSQINAMMVRSYLQDGHSIPKASLPKPFEGAISFGNAGIFRNVFKVDVASLYPSIILACDVFDVDKDPEGNFLKIVQTFTNERLKNKKLRKDSKYHDDLQESQKIVINSAYGFLGASGLNFNSPEAAEFITKTGRDILQTAITWAETEGMKIVNADTDSISFCKHDESPITEEEQVKLLAHLNSQYPDKIKFENDGFFPTVCVLKAKNYILYDGKKIKVKGSAIKAKTKCPALQEFINKIIDLLVYDKDINLKLMDLYKTYVREIVAIKDIKRWSARKTISERTLNSERTNESRIRDALKDTEYVEGDRAYFFFKDKDTLELVERFDGVYDKKRLLKNLYDTVWVFESVIDCELLFANYALKKHEKLLVQFQ